MVFSAMAENGILKIGKITDFQGHMIEHQVGAYTDCNHGQGLAVIHPHIFIVPSIRKLSLNLLDLQERVWNIDDVGKTEDEIACEGIRALADFIKEVGLPTTFTEMNVNLNDDTVREDCGVNRHYGRMPQKADCDDIGADFNSV